MVPQCILYHCFTIKAYPAAIALILKVSDTDVSNALELKMLLRSTETEIPEGQSMVTKWGLAFALPTLLEKTYESWVHRPQT